MLKAVYRRTPKRFEAYGWQSCATSTAHDVTAVNAAIEASKKVLDRPSLNCCKTIIARVRPIKPVVTTPASSVGEKEVAATRLNIGWNHPPSRSGGHLRGLDRGQRAPHGKPIGIPGSPPTEGFPQEQPSLRAARRANCRRTGASTRMDFSPRSTRKPRPSQSQGIAELDRSAGTGAAELMAARPTWLVRT